MSSVFVFGGLDPSSKEATRHAQVAYGNIRRQSNDCQYIARNVNMSIECVSLIKSYIFNTRHVLTSGFDLFSPSYEMAESWRRLSSKDSRHIQPHDVLLLQHEMLEIQYILQGYPQSNAHILASQTFNYQVASDAFYARNLNNRPRQ